MVQFTGYLLGKVQLDGAIRSEILANLVESLLQRCQSSDSGKKLFKFHENNKYSVECSERGLKLTSPSLVQDEGFESDSESIQSLTTTTTTTTTAAALLSAVSSATDTSSNSSNEIDLSTLMDSHLQIGSGGGDDSNSSSGNGSDSDELSAQTENMIKNNSNSNNNNKDKDTDSINSNWEHLPNTTSFQSYPVEDVIFCHADILHPTTLVWVVRHLSKMIGLVIAFSSHSEANNLFQIYRELRIQFKPSKYGGTSGGNNFFQSSPTPLSFYENYNNNNNNSNISSSSSCSSSSSSSSSSSNHSNAHIATRPATPAGSLSPADLSTPSISNHYASLPCVYPTDVLHETQHKSPSSVFSLYEPKPVPVPVPVPMPVQSPGSVSGSGSVPVAVSVPFFFDQNTGSLRSALGSNSKCRTDPVLSDKAMDKFETRSNSSLSFGKPQLTHVNQRFYNTLPIKRSGNSLGMLSGRPRDEEDAAEDEEDEEDEDEDEAEDAEKDDEETDEDEFSHVELDFKRYPYSKLRVGNGTGSVPRLRPHFKPHCKLGGGSTLSGLPTLRGCLVNVNMPVNVRKGDGTGSLKIKCPTPIAPPIHSKINGTGTTSAKSNSKPRKSVLPNNKKPVLMVPLKNESLSTARSRYPKEGYLYQVMSRSSSTFAPYQRSLNFLTPGNQGQGKGQGQGHGGRTPGPDGQGIGPGDHYSAVGWNNGHGQQFLVPLSSWLELAELPKIPHVGGTVSSGRGNKIKYRINSKGVPVPVGGGGGGGGSGGGGGGGGTLSGLKSVKGGNGTSRILLRDVSGYPHGMWSNLSQRVKRNLRDNLMPKLNWMWTPQGEARPKRKANKEVTFNAWATVQMI